MKIFILAAGVQKRFPKDYTPKQLLVINNERLLDRQLRQVREYGLEPFIISKNEIIRNEYNCLDPEKNRSVLDTIYSVNGHFLGRTVFLLGDVFYSKDVIKSIVEDKSELRFWMSGSEIFAFSFSESKYNEILTSILICLKKKGKDAKIWHLYRQLNQFLLSKHVIKEDQEIIGDYTSDVDSLEHYEEYKKYIETLSKEIL